MAKNPISTAPLSFVEIVMRADAETIKAAYEARVKVDGLLAEREAAYRKIAELEAAGTLNWACVEMDSRYSLIQEVGAKNLADYFEEDEVDRIYLNFSDPWTRKKKPKRRLTYRDFLKVYERLLKSEGQIHFKTDNSLLFEFSVREFEECGFTLSEVTRDLHNSEYDAGNVRTEFEQKFADQGIPIKRLVATAPVKPAKEA